VGGTVTIIADGVDLSKTTIHGKANNTTGTIGGLELVLNSGKLSQVIDSFVTREDATIRLGCDQTDPITLNKSFNLDLNGCNASGITVAAGKTLTVYDSATDDYKVLDEQGYGILSATGDVAVKEGYAVRTEASGKSYHRKEFRLVAAALRPSAAGIYYTGGFRLNDLFRQDVESYGVVLSLKANPKLGKADCQASTLTQWSDTGKGNGTLLNGIMKPDNTDRVNAQYAQTAIYGVAYIKHTNGTVEYSGVVRYTLQSLVEQADTMWQDLNQAQKDSLLDLYRTYTGVMTDWNIPNTKSAA
jgi:hypothetical protein